MNTDNIKKPQNMSWTHSDERDYIDRLWNKPQMLLAWMVTSYLREWSIPDDDVVCLRKRAQFMIDRLGVDNDE